MVDTNHHAGLVETHLVIAGHLYLRLEFSAVFRIVEGSVINGETIVRYAPVVTLGRYRHRKLVAGDIPL